ncbi:MAG: ImmA/IrrE family metallo-endopeptidase [Pseudomonadota bacterium]
MSFEMAAHQQQTAEADFSRPIPSWASKLSVMKFAEEQRRVAGLTSGFDLPDLVKENNGSIEYIGLFEADQTDSIIVEPDDTFTIYLSAHTGALRDHFTIAHELGHFLLHWPRVKSSGNASRMKATRMVDSENKELVRCEWEANWFASAFLMPEAEFREAFENGTASETFGVTPSAVRVRAKSLGCRILGD